MGESSAMGKRGCFFSNIDAHINVTTKERKEILLNQETYLIYQGKSYTIKFKSLGGGVWEMFAEKNFK